MLKFDHFEGGKNTTRGQRKGPDKVLVELLPQALTSAAGAGGGAAESLTVVGLKTTDTVVSAFQAVAGANSLPLLGAVNGAAGKLDCTWSADPGAGAVVTVMVLRSVPNK